MHVKQTESLHAFKIVLSTLHSDELCFLLQSDKFLWCSSTSITLFLQLLLVTGETLLFLVLLLGFSLLLLEVLANPVEGKAHSLEFILLSHLVSLDSLELSFTHFSLVLDVEAHAVVGLILKRPGAKTLVYRQPLFLYQHIFHFHYIWTRAME